MGMFLGIHVDGMEPWNIEKCTPVSIGRTHEEAQSKAITRIIGSCVLNGYITTVEQRDLTEEQFVEIGRLCDEFFKKIGLE